MWGANFYFVLVGIRNGNTAPVLKLRCEKTARTVRSACSLLSGVCSRANCVVVAALTGLLKSCRSICGHVSVNRRY